MSSKTFVLRAGAILALEDATLRFGDDNTIVVPLATIDRLKQYVRDRHEIPEKRRIGSNFLEYAKRHAKEIKSEKGFRQANGSILRVVNNSYPYDERIEADKSLFEMDKRIYQVCLDLKREYKEVILITTNPGILLRDMKIDVEVETFEEELFPEPKYQYKGFVDAFVTEKDIAQMYDNGCIPIEAIYHHDEIRWYENEFVDIKTEHSSTIGRYAEGAIHPIKYSKTIPNGYRALNLEQKMLWECLMAPPDIAPLVVVKGAAGTGKTFCALAYALEYLKGYSDGGIYDQILVATPMVTVSNESMGYLPGNIDEKVSPYLGGVMDNLKAIFREKCPEDSNRDLKDRAQDLFDREFIEIQPIGFLRGRTIPRTVFIIDETQNIKPCDIVDIVTRAATGSKFIFLGDPSQVNNPELNQRYNGLVHLSEKMKDDPLCWQITLSVEKSVRGALAQAALKRL